MFFIFFTGWLKVLSESCALAMVEVIVTPVLSGEGFGTKHARIDNIVMNCVLMPRQSMVVGETGPALVSLVGKKLVTIHF